jgi:hypothetical protein
LCACRTGRARRTYSAVGARGSRRTGRTWRTSGTFGAVRARRTRIASDTRRLTTKEHEEVESGVRWDARRDRRRERADHVTAERNDLGRADANAARGDAVDDRAGVLDLTNDGAARAVRLRHNTDLLIGRVEW